MIHNLYIINSQLHAFIAGSETLPDTITIRAGLGQDSENTTLYIHKEKCPLNIQPATIYDQITSLFSIAADSTLLSVTSTAVGASFTLNEFDNDIASDRIILMGPDSPPWHEFFHYMAPKYPAIHMDKLESCVLVKKAVVGINTKFKIHSFETEKLHKRGLEDTRASAFRSLAKNMRLVVEKEIGVDDETDATAHRPLLCFITRRGSTRRVINEQDLLNIFTLEKVNVATIDFQYLGINDQIKSVYQCDILVGVHHTLLAHMFAMKPGATVIELFPYGYHKNTFENLAQLLGLSYMKWQNTKKSSAVFDWEYIKNYGGVEGSADDIADRPIDWYKNKLISRRTSAQSRMYWRNQNTIVDIPSILQLVRIAIDRHEKYMIYMPWEQINNQLVEFKSACATASILDRILVLPLIGHRAVVDDADWDFSFRIPDFHWLPFEKYFDPTQFGIFG